MRQAGAQRQVRKGIRHPTDSCAPFHFVLATRNIVTLLEGVAVSGNSGAAVGAMAGNPLAGAAGAVFNQVAGIIGNDVPEFRLIFRCGAFDLA
jgi:outer membrane lipoprotein SlyB